MRLNLFLLILVLAAGGWYTWRNDLALFKEPSSSPVPLPDTRTNGANQVAPDFSFTDLNGKARRLSDFEDKAVVLNFWASWCAPCVAEFPQMTTLARHNPDKVVFIFLSSDDTRDDIVRFLRKHGKGLPLKNVVIGWDKDQGVAQKLYKTFRLPETYLLSPGRVIRQKVIGLELPWDQKAGQDAIGRLSP